MAFNSMVTMSALTLAPMDRGFNKPFRAVPLRRGADRSRRWASASRTSQSQGLGESGFRALLFLAPVLVFLTVFAWDWLPFNRPAAPAELSEETLRLLAMSEDELRSVVWPVSAESIEANQPRFDGRQAGDQVKADFTRCGTSSRFTCVIDGDTFWYKGDKIRIADIDTPEVSNPKCARELELGERATARLIALLNAGPVSLRPTNTEFDQFGRRLLLVTRNGRSLGDVLVREGLAERWGGPRIDWCRR